ncbi:Anaerobic glycerol-3-phosphate dehydrogenase subunit B [Trueperella bernardiae]|uniref:Anaerobic glycerol-3-phosphate dehydrogenase subunit B n=1 Tax=Trueperella bernardiae TaxID=59561 RepID=A0A0W1KKY9_9ACTO|nr:glycerol-3-phosphate dehydrogenase subunit GlpB [Trueperella bernardiae]KTF04270.1 Anaerobic glycerol-3-phosphate dehydrogenase subunit B [Trueperella bernardiae]
MRIIVIGSGLAGLTAALKLREAGHHVDIVTKGWGGLLLSSGTLDVYGWDKDGHPISDPYAEIEKLVAKEPGHPYASIGADAVREGVDWLCATTGLFAKPGKNVLIPTAIGAVRPTIAVQNTMVPSLMEDGKKFLVVGIRQFRDFPAAFIADNLARSPLAKVETRAVTISLAPRKPEADSTGTTFARAFDGTAGLDGPATRDSLINELRGHVRAGETILLPAILGFSPDAYQEIAAELGVPVGEVPVPPPSIPGRRINDVLIQLCHDKRVDISLNAEVIGFEADGGHVTALKVQRAGRVTTNKVDAVVYAGGGLESGTIQRDSYGDIRERVFDLPLTFLDAEDAETTGVTGSVIVDGKDLFGTGVSVNEDMLPLDGDRPVYDNLYLAGSIIGGARPWSEKSGEGIALGSAVAATRAILRRD